MFKRMLVPLDGSQVAEKVLPFVKQFADRLNLEVIFLHVCSNDQFTSRFMCQSYIEHVAELAGKRKKAQGIIIDGDPAKSVIRFADENFIDLLLLGTHGQSGFGRWMTGSTAHKIIMSAKMPVLLIPAAASSGIKIEMWPRKILIPLDGSPLAESVIPYVKMITRQIKSEFDIELLKICEPPDLLGDYPEAIMPLTWQEHVIKATSASQKACSIYLSNVVENFNPGNAQIRYEVILGDKNNVAGQIVKFAEKNSSDLIAMSTHGRSGISEWPFGHVTDRIVRMVSTPLFLIKPR
jgi:nucleotide-binding universal stress UspA family protein